jgi:hypothetical protein
MKYYLIPWVIALAALYPPLPMRALNLLILAICVLTIVLGLFRPTILATRPIVPSILSGITLLLLAIQWIRRFALYYYGDPGHPFTDAVGEVLFFYTGRLAYLWDNGRLLDMFFVIYMVFVFPIFLIVSIVLLNWNRKIAETKPGNRHSG